jgi:uncharacterized protein (DUF1330 family)
MIYVQIQHTVEDYAQWRPFFDAHGAARRSFGATGADAVYRGQADPNAITAVLEWDSADNARRFLQSPDLAETMKNAGVTSAPQVTFLTRT